MVAFLEPELYKQLYAISKEQSGNGSSNKWDDYNMVIEKNIFERIKQFIPVNPNSARNSKGFRLSKNGIDTGIFQKAERYMENVPIGNNINEDMKNDEEEHIDAMFSLNNKNKINILPINIINKEDN